MRKRKHGKFRMTIRLSSEQLRDMMENKLRPRSIPSKKKYDRKKDGNV